MIQTLDEAGFNFIRQQEGLVLHSYQDAAGIWTIGYGSTYYANGKHVGPGDPPLTLQGAKDLFINTSGQYLHAVAYWTKPVLTQNQFDALFSLVYNIGTNGFRGSTLLKFINEGVTGDGLKNAWYAWNRAGGVILQDLVERRKAEFELYNS